MLHRQRSPTFAGTRLQVEVLYENRDGLIH